MRAPEPLSKAHILQDFNSSRASLNAWLIDRALANEEQGASRTFVICEGDTQKVIGYYCLAQGAIGHDAVSAKFKKNMPNPLPVTVLGRLAIDQSFAGKGLGMALLRDAVLRSRLASKQAASRGIFVQALDEKAAGFYLKFGFTRSPTQPLYLMLSLT
jgi:GNAT superfamily N-acetyltransferase